MSSVTIHEMESVARGGPSMDIGITELSSSDLGFDMLSNAGMGKSSSGGGTRQISFDLGGGESRSGGGGGFGGGGLGEIEISPVEPISLNIGGGPMSGPSAPIEIEFSRNTSSSETFPKSSSAVEGGLFANSQSASGPFTTLSPAAGRLSPEEERKEKV
jgi:hypothetical protein